jgi:EpsI family protein
MKNKVKLFTVLILLSLTMLLSFAFPRTKYVGTNFISALEVPYEFTKWEGQDVSKKLNINTADTTFNFINKALANQYINSKGESLLFIILDAGNFHHPKVCFTGAGYKIKELDDTEFHTPDRRFKAHTLFTERGGKSSLSFYWIVIDKKVAHAWIEQKFKQLYFSMLNKQRVGLMVRLDIPAKEDNIEDAIVLARKFITDLSQMLQPEHADYIFGGNRM